MSSDRERRKREEQAARARRQHSANRKANKARTAAERLKPKAGDLPAKHVMDAIADSVHEAVTKVFVEMESAGENLQPTTPSAKIKGLCLYYAAAGQYVASIIVGRDYCVQVGSLGVDTDGEHMIKIDAANGGVAARRFHMWLAADDGGFVEYVDFTARFFKDWANEVEAKWDRDDLPTYVWGKQKDIAEQHGVFYKVEISEEPEADKFATANEALVKRIVDLATAIARKRLLE